jgi:hypothetical protein
VKDQAKFIKQFKLKRSIMEEELYNAVGEKSFHNRKFTHVIMGLNDDRLDITENTKNPK